MDKKQNFYSRQGSSSNKALISESRKSSDVFVNKPRSSARRRENSNLSNSKNDTQRNSKPGKSRPFTDKRPRPRGGAGVGGGNTVGAQSLNSSASSSGLVEYDNIIDEANIEFNSIYNPGSKKQNLNHLLNFHYKSAREHDSSLGSVGVFSRNGNRNYFKKHKYNKEQFLQANFQFVINSNAELSILNASSPDSLVDWSLIEQINIQTVEEPQCPICLYPPIAAKLTKCGHAYCWPCILHYLSLSDKVWRKCPICYDAIYLADLKSTAIVQQTPYNVGDLVTLQLMRRKKGSMFIEKIDTDVSNDGKIPHISAEADQKKFSKFLLANSNEILSIIERERLELISSETEDCPEFIFIQQATDLLNERKATIRNLGSFENVAVDSIQFDNATIKENTSCNSNDIEAAAVSSSNNNIVIDHNNDNNEIKNLEIVEQYQNQQQNLQVQQRSATPLKETGNKYYYFYQVVDGQNIYLHPLNVKMLQAMYGTLDKGPFVIKAQILQKEVQSMDEDLRKKFTCLGHLPLTCQFEIVEIQLDPPVVSEEILMEFKDDIMLREKTRLRRAREEKQREKQINEINERQMGKIIARSANIDIKSSQQFPICGSEDGSMRNSFGEASFLFDLSDSPPPPPSAVMNNFPPEYTSFANILSSPKRELWPSLGGDNSNAMPEATWAIKSTTPVHVRCNSTISTESTATEATSNVGQNLGDVLAEALQQKVVSTGNNAVEKGGGNSKKNKKNKKMLLFSTGMNFNGN